MPKEIDTSKFSEQLINWQKKHGRKDLPWQNTRDPYKRWLAEVMLQQTQVNAVIPYYLEFLRRFPRIEDLAKADEEEVLSLWAGLGYYSRARNLLKSAKEIVEKYNGQVPLEKDLLIKLPGIGLSTTGAILSAVTDQPYVILDGNVKRVLCRYLKVPTPLDNPQTSKLLLSKAKEFLPKKDGAVYAQSLMDLGAMICKRSKPLCDLCPVANGCKAFKSGQQDSFPIRKAKRDVPQETLPVAICFQENKVLLVQQKERFWKGLWTLPICTCTLGARQLPAIHHRLTHLMLEIVPYIVSKIAIADCQGRWYTREELAGGAVPTPIKKLLSSIEEWK